LAILASWTSFKAGGIPACSAMAAGGAAVFGAAFWATAPNPKVISTTPAQRRLRGGRLALIHVPQIEQQYAVEERALAATKD